MTRRLQKVRGQDNVSISMTLDDQHNFKESYALFEIAMRNALTFHKFINAFFNFDCQTCPRALLFNEEMKAVDKKETREKLVRIDTYIS